MPWRKRWSGWIIAGIAGLILTAPPARLATAADADDAKAHYQKATAHFAVGEYREAAVEYEEAFKLKQDPALLYNAAQSFRLAGDNQKALLLYNNIVKLYPGTSYAAESKDRIAKMNAAAAQAPAAPATVAPQPATPPPVTAAPPPVAPIAPAVTPPPALPPPPAATPVPAAPAPAPAPLVSAPALSTSAPPAEPGHPIYTRWWFWAAAGAVVVAGVVTGIALSSGGSAGPWSNVGDVKGAYIR